MSSLASAPAPVLPRRRQLLLGTSIACIGVVVFYLTLIGMYLNARTAAGTGWLSEKTIPLTQANMAMGTLILGSIAVQWAVWAIARDVRGQTYFALGLTALFAAAFVNQTTFLWKAVNLVAGEAEYGPFYAVSAGHMLLVVAAMLFVVVAAIRAIGGNYSSRYPDGVSAAALFWHVTVGLYAVLWLGVYILK